MVKLRDRAGIEEAPKTPSEVRSPAWRPDRMWFETRLLPWLLLAPAAAVIFGLVLFPVARTFWLSFREAGLASLVAGESTFIGFANYLELIRGPHLRGVFFVTAVFSLSCVVGTMLVGFGVAALANQPFRGRALLGVLILLPWAVPRVAASIVWKWMFHDQYGIVNWFLTVLGAEAFSGFPWFNSRLPAFTAIWVVVVWQSFPFVALALLAGFQSISPELMEAAEVDGASALQRFRFITLPLLKPLILVLVVVSTIWDFKIFDQVYVMTEGGPARATEVLAITTWREAFGQLDFGVASALATAMFLILVAVTIVYIRLSGPELEEA